MRERGILFSGEMVRALLEARKSQTRRVVQKAGRDNCIVKGKRSVHVLDAADRGLCPYGQPGDLLYVRETFRVARTYDTLPPRELPDFIGEDFEPFVQFAAEGEDEPGVAHHWGKWRRSIHMPKAFARIWLRVTDVRVERVQEITHDDAIAEGLDVSDTRTSWEVREQHARVPFARLWDSINADRGHPWDSNPWVWVVEFELAEAP